MFTGKIEHAQTVCTRPFSLLPSKKGLGYEVSDDCADKPGIANVKKYDVYAVFVIYTCIVLWALFVSRYTLIFCTFL